MKKILLLITILIVLTGCQNKNIEINQEVKSKGFVMKLTNVEFSDVCGSAEAGCILTSNETYDYKGLGMFCSKEIAEDGKDYVLIEAKLEYTADTKATVQFDLKLNNEKALKAYIIEGDQYYYVDGTLDEKKKNLMVDPNKNKSFILRASFYVDENDKDFTITLPFGYEYKLKRN